MTEPSRPSPSPRPQNKRDHSGRPQQPVGDVTGRARATPPADRRHSRPPVTTRRRVPRWAVLAVVVVALLGVGVYKLLAVGGGGSAKIGETFTLKTGLGLSVSAPQKYSTDDTSLVGPGEQAYQVIVAVNNNTGSVLPSPGVAISAEVNGESVDAIYPDGPLAQAIDPNVQLNLPFRFKVKNGTSGPLQIAVNDPSHKPVYFTGAI